MRADSALRKSADTPTADVLALPAAVRPLRICLLGYRSHPYGGGQGIYLHYLSKALVDLGHSVDVISGEPYPQLDARVRLIPMPGMNLYEKGLGSLRLHHLRSWANVAEWVGKLTGNFSEPYAFGCRVAAYMRTHSHQYDVIHDNQCLAWGMLKLQQRGLPVVTTIHHPITRDRDIAVKATEGFWMKLLVRRWHGFLGMQKKVARRLSHIITVSECSRRDIAEAFGVDARRITLIYNGIDTNVFRPMPDVAKIPYRLMATASADQPLKGLRYLLEAFAQLLPRYPQLSLLLVSKPRAGGETEQLIEQLGIGDRITFVSGISTEQLVQYYAQAAVAVVPSVYEGFGLPAGEAMACGVPLVSSRGGALPEVVGDAGVLVPVKDVNAMAQAIAGLLEDSGRRDALAHAGRERMLHEFNWALAARDMTRYYEKAIADANG
ncbi:MAG TPA: glycosyltransferase family 4 protein [Pseudomonadales bacterium]|jgi:glycosyltransferase involved in cell wall biosynthesis